MSRNWKKALTLNSDVAEIKQDWEKKAWGAGKRGGGITQQIKEKQPIL